MSETEFTYKQLKLLNKIANHLANAIDISETLTTMLHWLANDCDMERGVITITNNTGTEVQAEITVGEIHNIQSDKMRYKLGEGITGKVFATRSSIFLPMVEKGDIFLYRSGIRNQLDVLAYSFLCAPVIYQKNVIGTISVDKKNNKITNSQLDILFLEEVATLIAPFLQRRTLEEKMKLFHRAKQQDGAFAKMIGKSTAIKEIQNLIVCISGVKTTVLITGETGVGKGVVAEIIHKLGANYKQPFVEVNCGAIPENLIESELFGHEKGAFTGAINQRKGILERAKGGTVFLDEVGELPPNAQIKLLRVLQNREFERVGGSTTLRSTARIIAATNKHLESAIIDGTFRSDLYYRLNVFPIPVPSLRERGASDIMLLVNHFIQQFSQDIGKQITRIDTPAIDMLTAYHWPGNVRELENVIERAVLLADNNVIHGHHLPPSLLMNKYSSKQEDMGNFNVRVKNFEIELITEALKDCNGNQSAAARKLGLSNRIIQYKISNYKIDYRRFRTSKTNPANNYLNTQNRLQ